MATSRSAYAGRHRPKPPGGIPSTTVEVVHQGQCCSVSSGGAGARGDFGPFAVALDEAFVTEHNSSHGRAAKSLGAASRHADPANSDSRSSA